VQKANELIIAQQCAQPEALGSWQSCHLVVHTQIEAAKDGKQKE
jgi:hypothetical protein